MMAIVLIMINCLDVLAQVSKRFQMSFAAIAIKNQIAN